MHMDSVVLSFNISFVVNVPFDKISMKYTGNISERRTLWTLIKFERMGYMYSTSKHCYPAHNISEILITHDLDGTFLVLPKIFT